MAFHTALSVRRGARSGIHTGHTSGLAPGHIQANLLILPSRYASDFAELCARNPVSCPLIGTTTTPGDPRTFDDQSLFSSSDIDIRTDVPRYNVYRSGRLVGSKSDILQEWSDDSVAFLIGCSYSFEQALADAGLVPRSWEQCSNVAMYNTKLRLNPAGVFTGAYQVVSMRPYRPEDVERVRQVCRRYLKTHGEPVAWGWTAVQELGIGDMTKPDYGDFLEIRDGEVPVFWGCGVTPQAAITAAGSKIGGLVMAHVPGHMVVLDLTEDEMFAETARESISLKRADLT